MVVAPLRAPSVPAFPQAFALLRAWGAALLAERERWPLWLPVGFGTGVALYFGMPVEPPLWLGAALGAAGLAGAVVAVRSVNTALRVALAALAAVTLGFAHAKLREARVEAPVLARKAGPVGIDALVEQIETHGKGVRIVLGEIHARRFKPTTAPARVRLSLRRADEGIVPGAWIHVTAVLMPPPGPAAPGGYDFGRAAFFDRIGAVGYAYGKARPIAPLSAPTLRERLTIAVATLRWHLTGRIRAVLPGSTGGIAAALITGERGLVSDADEAALRDAGLAHVLAIAGLHMALVGLGLFWVVRAILAAIPAIALRIPIKKWAAVAALGGATFYLVISGAATPATRAYIMLATMLLAILLDRPALSMRSVALAAFIVLLLRPESITEPGFQMSFAAVAGLVAVAEWEARRRMQAERSGPKRLAEARRYVHGIAVTSFVGSIATAPYAIFHFDRATHYAVLGNLLAMPIMGFIAMPAAAVAIMAMPFGLEKYPLLVLGFGIEIMLKMGRFVSGLPGAISTVPAWPVGALVLISLGGLWVFLWRRSWRWLGLVPMAAGVVLALTWRGPDILVARDAATVAVRGSDGVLRLVRKARDDYSAEEWLKRDGDAHDADDAVAGPKDGVRCDGYGCIAHAPDGTVVAAVARIDALDEDCAKAAIVISSTPADRDCKGPKLVIDRFDVARNGGYAVALPDLAVRTVEGERGQRPWSQQSWSQRPRAAPRPGSSSQYRRIKPTSLPWMRTRSAP